MNNLVMKVSNLVKEYNGRKVLDNINITIEKGHIYGFVGRNGAGKTTLLRIIAGLSFSTCGELSLFGSTSSKSVLDARRKMGSLIETPALYANLTARQNLELFQMGIQTELKKTVDDLLINVGLDSNDKKLVKHYSLGMKQRLAIAVALLGNPLFLILDEPINGLDPLSILDIRKLLLKLCENEGVTILISSHILSELYQLATDYIIIDNGKIIEEISHEELDYQCRQFIKVEVSDSVLASQILSEQLQISDCKLVTNSILELYNCSVDVNSITKTLVQSNINIKSISVESDSLESYFANRIGGNYVK